MQQSVGLTEQVLSAATDPTRFSRGEDYVRYVTGLRRTGNRASGTIQAKRVYQVELDWSGALAGTCTCVDHAEGYFCKHQVALGLALIDSAPAGRLVADVAAAPSGRDGASDPLAAFVQDLDRDQLVALVTELVERDPQAREHALARAAAAGRADALDPAELTARVNSALSRRGYIDYRRSFDVAHDAQKVLDGLEDLLAAGATTAVQPALLRAVTRLRKLAEQADDSGGTIGDAGQRAVDLYARACRAGHPNPVALARWLVKFRRDSPGWPDTRLADFAPAFDDKALRFYREAVAQWTRDAATEDRFSRFEVDRARLELADHDGDLDLAVSILSEDAEHRAYGDIVGRLLAAGRGDEALQWLERAAAAGRVSGHAGQDGNDFWVGPTTATRLYLQAGRPEDALAVLRSELRQRPQVRTWRALLELAGSVGREEQERRRAVEQLEAAAAAPFGSGAALVQIYLSEDRLDEAWRVADRLGAGQAWQQLATASASSRPAAAAQLFRPQIEELLSQPNTRVYAAIAGLLRQMRDLERMAGQQEDFERYLSNIRGEYRRRTSLMKQLDAHGLLGPM